MTLLENKQKEQPPPQPAKTLLLRQACVQTSPNVTMSKRTSEGASQTDHTSLDRESDAKSKKYNDIESRLQKLESSTSNTHDGILDLQKMVRSLLKRFFLNFTLLEVV